MAWMSARASSAASATMVSRAVAADSLHGGAGDDTLQVSTLDFSLSDGGTGIDTLKLTDRGPHLALTTSRRPDALNRVHRTSGTGDTALTQSVRDILNLSDERAAGAGHAGAVQDQLGDRTLAKRGGSAHSPLRLSRRLRLAACCILHCGCCGIVTGAYPRPKLLLVGSCSIAFKVFQLGRPDEEAKSCKGF